LLKLDRSKRIWVEGESQTIGRIFLPDPFWSCMKDAALIEIDTPKEDRIKRLILEYGKCSKEEMENAIICLGKRIGEVRKNEILKQYQGGKLESAAIHLLDYYDKMYHHSRLQSKNKVLKMIFTDGNAFENASKLRNAVIFEEKLMNDEPGQN